MDGSPTQPLSSIPWSNWQTLGLDDLAEGIEETAKLEILRNEQCDSGQGLYSRGPSIRPPSNRSSLNATGRIVAVRLPTCADIDVGSGPSTFQVIGRSRRKLTGPGVAGVGAPERAGPLPFEPAFSSAGPTAIGLLHGNDDGNHVRRLPGDVDETGDHPGSKPCPIRDSSPLDSRSDGRPRRDPPPPLFHCGSSSSRYRWINPTSRPPLRRMKISVGSRPSTTGRIRPRVRLIVG